MVHYAPLIGAVAVAASLAAAAPMPQYGSSYGSSYGDSSDQYSSSDSYDSTSTDDSTSTYGYSSSSNYYNQYSTSTDDSTSTYYSSSSYYNQYSSSDEYSSSTYYDNTSTDLSTSTYSSYSSYSTPSYGSGSSYWGGSSYEDCVQQCVAEFGNGMSTMDNSNSYATATSGSYGTGATHTVIVAPSQGVLRYVPFYVNANVGDTVSFVWHANEHTVTKSSALEMCNKTDDAPFASGEQNASFVFNQVVNDTNPTFFYCGTPTHCEKGMFGMINANTTQSSTSVQSMLPSMLSNSSTLTAMWSYQQNVGQNNTYADSWGSDIDMSGLPDWSQDYVAQNVLFTRTFLRANPDVINADGSISLGNAQSLMVPNDLGNTLAAAGAQDAASSSAPSSSSSSAAAATSTAAKSGAGSITAPRVAIALVAVAATFFAL